MMTTVTVILGILLIIACIMIGAATKANSQLMKMIKENETHLVTLNDLLNKEKLNNQQIISQKKSSETRLGQISENITPFLEAYPYDPKNSHFLGQPIDFIVFDYDDGKIVFLEVKTGGAKESHRQRLIKNIIKSGRVYYEKLRINEKGAKIKREKNDDEQA